MNPQAYAQVLTLTLKGKTPEEASRLLKNFLEVLAARGHRKLLPGIVAELEKEKEAEAGNKARFTVARKSDLEKFRKSALFDLERLGVKDAELVTKEDDSLVGGYRVETRSAMVDRTHKRALLDLYRKLIA
ncbi:MAG TPA: F0F1 ATP synthase subunit delta [Candidatus Paceibacterota bacterium]|nr:F0F1 ATP synthase subunit delta [Candidatus Paceibacterota bacterium]